MWVPGAIHAASTSGSRAAVAVITTLAPVTASCTESETMAPMSWAARIARSMSRPQIRTWPSAGRTHRSASTCRRAWIPVPSTATTSTRSGASHRAATPPAAPVRRSVSSPPSSKKATGAPVAASNTSTSPSIAAGSSA